MNPDPCYKVRFLGVEKMLHCVADASIADKFLKNGESDMYHLETKLIRGKVLPRCGEAI